MERMTCRLAYKESTLYYKVLLQQNLHYIYWHKMKTKNTTYKVAFGLALAAGLFLIWMNLAVGIIGDSDDPANLMYVGVLVIGLIGAVIARFQAVGMSRALYAMVLAMAIIAFIPIGTGMHLTGRIPPPANFLFIHAVFIALFAGSGWLFGRAAQHDATMDIA